MRFLPGAISYFFSDHLGSSRVLTNSSGTVVEDSDFYPVGGERPVISNDPNQYKFTGKERDSESGLDNYGSRYYGSSLGRFMSPDEPLVDQFEGNPQSWNLYAYVRNNPLSFIDPTGQSCITTDDGLPADDGDGKGCEEAGVKPDGEDGKKGEVEPDVVIVDVWAGLTPDERAQELAIQIYERVTDPSILKRGLKAANPIAGALSECVEGNCGSAQALALIPFGGRLKNLRIIKTGRPLRSLIMAAERGR